MPMEIDRFWKAGDLVVVAFPPRFWKGVIEDAGRKVGGLYDLPAWPVKDKVGSRYHYTTRKRPTDPCSYVHKNITLDLYATKIQRYWRAHHQRCIAAAIMIQRQFRKSNSDPKYALCRKRLLREWGNLSEEMPARCSR